MVVFIAGRGTGRRIHSVARLAELDAQGNYTLRELAHPTPSNEGE